jgi:hypothetical protein
MEHCESCGSTDREDLTTGDQGYTACCNECICSGGYRNRYGTPTNYKIACCWAKAELAFGGPDRVPEGSYRLP